MLYVCKNRSWNIFLRLSLSFFLFSDSWNWKTSQVQTGPVRVPTWPSKIISWFCSFKHLSFITLTFHVTYWQTQPTLWMNSADRFVSFVNLWTPMLSICTKQKLLILSLKSNKFAGAFILTKLIIITEKSIIFNFAKPKPKEQIFLSILQLKKRVHRCVFSFVSKCLFVHFVMSQNLFQSVQRGSTWHYYYKRSRIYALL